MSNYWLINAQSVNKYIFFESSDFEIENNVNLKGWKDVSKEFKELKKESKFLGHLLQKKQNEFKYVDQLLEANNLPILFSYIPLITSGYRSSYKNDNGKCGIWGLDYITALHQGLVLNRNIDERMHDSIATLAAIDKLKELMDFYKDEKLSFISFITSKTHISSYNTINRYQHIFEFIKFLDQLSLNNLKKNNIVNDRSVFYFKSKYNLNFDAICFFEQINLTELQKNNTFLINSVIPKNYPLIVTKSELDFLNMNQEKIFHFQDSMLNNDFFIEDTTIKEIHIVQKGDVLGKIALQYNVKVNEIMAWNNLNNSTIYIDQKLNIYKDHKFSKQKFEYYQLKGKKHFWEVVEQNNDYKLLELLNYNKYQSIKTSKKLKIIKK